MASATAERTSQAGWIVERVTSRGCYASARVLASAIRSAACRLPRDCARVDCARRRSVRPKAQRVETAPSSPRAPERAARQIQAVVFDYGGVLRRDERASAYDVIDTKFSLAPGALWSGGIRRSHRGTAAARRRHARIARRPSVRRVTI